MTVEVIIRVCIKNSLRDKISKNGQTDRKKIKKKQETNRLSRKKKRKMIKKEGENTKKLKIDKNIKKQIALRDESMCQKMSG
jgi:hypothetical protein